MTPFRGNDVCRANEVPFRNMREKAPSIFINDIRGEKGAFFQRSIKEMIFMLVTDE